MAISFQSCDPGLRFEIVNGSEDSASAQIIHYSKGRYIHSNPDRLDELDTLYIPLSPITSERDHYNLVASLGTWTMENNFDDLAKSIKRIELHSRKETRIYSDSFQIRNLLWTNIKGHSKEKIIITIE